MKRNLVSSGSVGTTNDSTNNHCYSKETKRINIITSIMRYHIHHMFNNMAAVGVYATSLFVAMDMETLYTVVLCRNSYCNTIGQSSFISSVTGTARPLIKLKPSVLLIMYTWLNGFYRVMDGKYSITLLFFGSNTRRASLLRPRPSTVSIASAVKRN